MIRLFERAAKTSNRLAVIDARGEYSYGNLLESAKKCATKLLDGSKDMKEAPIALLVSPGFDYVAVQWGIWLAGGIAVPLSITYPLSELEYVLQDTSALKLVTSPDFAARLEPSNHKGRVELITTGEALSVEAGALPDIDSTRRAMILYTSGTTSKPKGVVMSHANVEAQITCLIQAWDWRPVDRILLVLPLHHTHGIINVLSCALWAGAACDMMPGFDSQQVWQKFIDSPLTIFMAVPTIYVKLIAAWEQADEKRKKEMSDACRKMRLMISGSAALPVQVLEKWRKISGHTLLERYGMTEIGMALSNPLEGERRPGFVGRPLPGVEIKLSDEKGDSVDLEGESGEIHVRSPNVFVEYWNKPEESRRAFRNGWFMTGDVSVVIDGYYKILGRNSVDIIKTAGYKVSALEIEEVLRTHPLVKECAVVGIEDPEWGERVCAVCIFNKQGLSLEELRLWAKSKLAKQKIPSRLLAVDELPRNAMGKIEKPALKALLMERAVT